MLPSHRSSEDSRTLLPAIAVRRAAARGLAGALLLALVAAPSAARAEPPSREVRAAAVALFDEARALMAAGKYEVACPKLAESQRLDPGIGTLYNLSDCNEHLGKIATAWIGFREVASEALASGQAEREKRARARAAALEAKLSRLQIVVPPEADAAGMEVKRDGAVVGKALWGTAVPVDPGQHTVTAEAPARKAWETTVALDKPGVVSVTVPPLAAADGAAASSAAAPQVAPGAVAPAPSMPAAPSSPADTSAPASDAAPSSGGWRAPVGIVALGVGVVGLGVGTALGFMAKSTFDDANANDHCGDDGRCDDVGLGLRDDAVAQGNLGTAVFVAGAVFAAGGAILWLTAPSSPSPATTSAASPGPRVTRLGVGAGSFAVEGVF